MTPLALTMGDPAGIGPEITLKAWDALKGSSSRPFFVIADGELLTERAARFGLKAPLRLDDISDCAEVFQKGLPVLKTACPDVDAGMPNPEAASAITGSIETAVTLARSGAVAGVVTNPIAKSVLYSAGFKHPGHTEYLAELCRTDKPLRPIMLMANSQLKVALATIHIGLKDVPSALTQAILEDTIRIVDRDMKQKFGLDAPRIALCGLNPHAGEDGAMGDEEINVINPVAAKLRRQGIHVSDARSADTLFHAEARETYDVAIAMYHDQGLIPVKTLDFHGGVNVTLGLPIIRTSPDHGTAFDIAHLGTARPDSLIAAIKMASGMADHHG